MKLDVLVVGDYCFDLILTDLPSEAIKGKEIFAGGLKMMIGGATFPTSMALKRLGLEVEIHMHLGTDFLSRYALEVITDAGFDPDLITTHNQPFRKITVAISYPDDRAFLSFFDQPPMSSEGRRYDGAPLEKKEVSHLHFAHLSAILMAEDMLDEAKRQNLTISTDCGWVPWALDHPNLWDILGRVDVFLPNEVELLHITRTQDLESALRSIRDRVPLTAAKLGERGSAAVTKTAQAAAAPIAVRTVETTSAGDCFNAGFLYGWLQGWSLEKALQCGNICGGLSTTASGWEATPTRDELEDWLKR
jgi:sugar/nucleoside kinase (ribokinase family)